MTELFFKGKEFVYNHHLAVPHRPLVDDAARSVGVPVSGNLIIQGDQRSTPLEQTGAFRDIQERASLVELGNYI